MALSIDLAGKTALVTGTTSGLGAGIARVLTQAGCTVMGCGRRPENAPAAQRFLETARKEGCGATYVQADVSRREDLERLAQQAEAQFDALDILVSNAGINVFKGVDGCTEEDWHFNDALNLKAHWLLPRLCKRLLDKAESPVVQIITSNHAYATMPTCFPYNVAKAGLLGLVQAMAIAWAPHCRVVGIAPGYIETETTQPWFDTFDDPAEARIRTESIHPVTRLGSVEEVGGLCAFLASPYAGFITGNTVLMDGGRSCMMEDRSFLSS